MFSMKVDPYSILLFVAIFMSSSRTIAQNDHEEYRKWKNAALSDRVRLDAINIVILGVVFTDPDSAISLANQQLNYATKIKSDKNIAEAHNNLGIANAITGRNSEAVVHLEKSISLLEKRNATEELGVIHSNLGEVYRQMGDLTNASKQLKKSLECYKVVEDHIGLANVLNNLANLSMDRGDIAEALNLHLQSMALSEKAESVGGIARSTSNIALIYDEQGQYALAIEWYLKSLSLYEDTKDLHGKAIVLNNLGIICKNQGDYHQAHAYYEQSLKIRGDQGDISGQAETMVNMAILFEMQGMHPRAEELYQDALLLNQKAGAIAEVAGVLLNYAGLLATMERKTEAFDMLDKAYHIFDSIGIPSELAAVELQIAALFQTENNIAEAKRYALSSLDKAQSIGLFSVVKDASYLLYEIHKTSGNQVEALKMFELYSAMKDSIVNADALRAVVRQMLTHEHEQRIREDSVLHAQEKQLIQAEVKARDAEIARARVMRYTLFGGVFLLVAFLGLVFHRFRVTKKQKRLIQNQKQEVEIQRDLAQSEHEEAERQKKIAQKEHQLAEDRKLEVEEKNRELLDSIQYAKRLQDAILPPVKLVKEYFDDSFVLYRPKDIVSGDFYWMETHEDLVLFAVADCTGHGVPGALVSVVCANALNKAVKELGIHDPGKILNTTRSIVIETLTRSGNKVQDGMDISLCVLNEGAKQLQWAGANNPLWIVRNATSTIDEFKADKQPIGLYGDAKPFITNHINVNHGDMIYLFSDGYADQFGGNTAQHRGGKKLKASRFKELIVQNRALPMAEQRTLFEHAFDDWKGELEQIDDVCVIGVRINGTAENPFSAREIEIIQLLSRGLSSKMIADQLNLSSHTVDTHRRRILRKANAANTPELLDFCRKLRIIQ